MTVSELQFQLREHCHADQEIYVDGLPLGQFLVTDGKRVDLWTEPTVAAGEMDYHERHPGKVDSRERMGSE